MRTEPAAQRARRYLLGEVTGDEALALEEEYFDDDRAQDVIAAAEDTLVEDYLNDALPANERARFERVYLASAGHRIRVETVRRLRAAAVQAAERRHAPVLRFGRRWGLTGTRAGALAAAAVLLIVVGAATWMRSSTPAGTLQPASSETTASKAAESAPRRSSAPRTFAFTLPPVTVRGADESAVLVIPPDTDTVALECETEADGADVVRGIVRTVGGDRIWDGPATSRRTSAGASVRVNVPAARLQPDDYIVTLMSAGPRAEERGRYVLQVRAR